MRFCEFKREKTCAKTTFSSTLDKNERLETVGYGPLYNPYKSCLGVCLASCRSLNNVYTATSICIVVRFLTGFGRQDPYSYIYDDGG